MNACSFVPRELKALRNHPVLSVQRVYKRFTDSSTKTDWHGIADLFILFYQCATYDPIVRKFLDAFIFLD